MTTIHYTSSEYAKLGVRACVIEGEVGAYYKVRIDGRTERIRKTHVFPTLGQAIDDARMRKHRDCQAQVRYWERKRDEAVKVLVDGRPQVLREGKCSG